MITTDKAKGASIKAIRDREKKEEEKRLRDKCEQFAVGKFTEEAIVKLSNQNKGIWYLPILDEDGEIELLLVLRPINRHILSYASTKISEDGLYIFLEACMRECYLCGDMEIIDEDEYFIPAAMKFNNILEGKKAAMVKR